TFVFRNGSFVPDGDDHAFFHGHGLRPATGRVDLAVGQNHVRAWSGGRNRGRGGRSRERPEGYRQWTDWQLAGRLLAVVAHARGCLSTSARRVGGAERRFLFAFASFLIGAATEAPAACSATNARTLRTRAFSSAASRPGTSRGTRSRLGLPLRASRA